ncbi:geranyl diphosphate synthase / farnesyl diphosphate synthase [Campylobacter lari]|uniref:geranyl diphosphate synthase / farnesyl diphosphate synthase n=1 Tax=Campylobacter lari TaxID=201 RepID=UPI00057EBC3D|nr:geranyl diphosphate synthase / farnesyl diphosphate synthase [Campylobacter lari]EAK0847690.1 geranyl diphosphate synthase / farnesyl diphosphate synthase [Campylobacter lari]EAK0979997.1 geranyl diphosphate synthase / farnesyl diphosphate synthase [Campylobacter lari]EAK9954394.1 geranyl diphosphate synthase / farnesyl diphosphate synthase [Campylobacter lari]MCR6542684.1 geranyl diphosphate synthase / farnesyl diphosphate synthase [Campylobacter lari]
MLELFNEHLEKNLPKVKSFHPFFNEALALMLKAGGKHFRAQLLLGIVKAKMPSLIPNALSAALALEFIHTYSLIHDDLPAMDNADFRRGTPTLHKTYDETTAILVGDALNTEAFLLLSKLDLKENVKLKLIQTLAFNAGLGGMIIGQAIDCYFEDMPLNLEQVEFLHIHKTARLIAASLKMGCEICELDEKECEQIYEIGLLIGLVFQIKDDIIDATLDTQEAGKPTHNDLHKNSFVKLLGLEGAKKAKDDKIALCEEKMKNLDSKLSNELQILIDKYLKG